MSNPNYDEILSTTLANHLPKLIDNVFTARPLAYFLKQAGQIRMVGGGHKIVIPLLTGKNTTVETYSEYDSLTTTAQSGITSAEYPWKQLSVTVAINGLEEAQNSSTEQVIDLLEAKVMQAEQSAIDKFDQMLVTSNGTGNSGKDWLGLEGLVIDATGTYGGINATTHSYWRSSVTTVAGALSLSDMSSKYNTVSEGSDQPNLILTSQDQYEAYEALLQPQLRFTSAETADAGFQNLLYKGAPMVFDSYVDAADMFFLNTRYLRLVGHKDKWFKATPFVRPNNQDARYAQILCYGDLTASNRSRQGALTGLT